METNAKKLSKSRGKKMAPPAGQTEEENKPAPAENEDVMDIKFDHTKQVPVSPAKSATSSPAKKRARLSLKGKKSVQKLSSFFGPDASPQESNTAPSIHGGLLAGKCDRPDNVTLYGKPCVASLHNLGNTCFLNSVLQVLRHTPGFLGMLSDLSKEVTRTENLQDFVVAETTSEDDDEEVMTWTLVKALDDVFQKMKFAEDKFKSRTSHYLAVRPYDMMSAIERINPMFEGNMQHDVHELLRCLLAYMQDAMRELNKVRSNYQEMYAGDNVSITLRSRVKTEPQVATKAATEEGQPQKMEEEGFEKAQVIREDGRMVLTDITETANDVASQGISVDSEVNGESKPKEPVRRNRLTKTKKEAGNKGSNVKVKVDPIAPRIEVLEPNIEIKTEGDALSSTEIVGSPDNLENANEVNSEETDIPEVAQKGAKKSTAKGKTLRTPRNANKEKNIKTSRKNSGRVANKNSETLVEMESTEENGTAESSMKEQPANGANKLSAKANTKRQSRKLTNQVGQKKLNGFLSSVVKTEKTEGPFQHGLSEKASKGPEAPEKQNGPMMKVDMSSPQKNTYKTPEKAYITLSASSPITAKQMCAKHKLTLKVDNPASGDTAAVVAVEIKEELGATEDSHFKAALHSPTQVASGECVMVNGNAAIKQNGAKHSPSPKSGSVNKIIKKSQRGRVVKCTPKAAALVTKASKKRKLSNEDDKDSDSESAASLKSPSKPSKTRGKSLKSAENTNSNGSTVKVNGKENSKDVNGSPSVDPKQMNVLNMLKNPAPRKRLGVRGSLVRKPSKEEPNNGDVSLNLSDQVDGTCDDPYIRDREPFEDNPPDMVQEILNSGVAGTFMPVYFSSDESENEEIPDSQNDTANDFEVDITDWFTPYGTGPYDSFDEYITDSSESGNDTESDTEWSDVSESKDSATADSKADLVENIPLQLNCAKDSGDKRAFSTSPESTSSQSSLKLGQKKLRLTESDSFNSEACSNDSDIDGSEILPQLDGVFDDWKIPRPKQTARKSCPPDRATSPSRNGDCLHGNDSRMSDSKVNEAEIKRNEEIKEAFVQGHQAFVKLSTADVPSYLQQQVLAALQSQVNEQGEVSDSVKKTFEGDMALRTRCLECENFTERREAYQDISLAVKKVSYHDDSDCENEAEGEDSKQSSSQDELAWLHSALADVEFLNGDNKYFCERCEHLTEAERSLHYVTLPGVLTLHLKRFAATNGFFGGLTKVNDHVPTPLELPCIRDKCAKNCSDPSHRYSLYGVITHTGISICSGHYIAYVKVTDQNLWRDVDTFPNGNDSSNCNNSNNGNGNHGDDNNGNQAVMPMQTDDGLADPNNNADTNNNLDVNDMMPNQNMISSRVDQSTEAEATESNQSVNSTHNTRWLECDDDTITVLSNSEFEDILSSNSGAGTPYMLFYHTVLDQFDSMRV